MKYDLSFIELHNPFFMQGSNLGNKINAAMRGAKLVLDDDRQVVWVYFKNKISFIPLASVASADALVLPDDIKDHMNLNQTQATEAIDTKPRRGRPPVNREPLPALKPIDVPYPNFDPNDQEAAARHRALVRAASANANRATQGPQNDDLIQQTRAQAMGVKLNRVNAQVQTAEQVGQSTQVTGKPKAINHKQLKSQIAQEMKE